MSILYHSSRAPAGADKCNSGAASATKPATRTQRIRLNTVIVSLSLGATNETQPPDMLRVRTPLRKGALLVMICCRSSIDLGSRICPLLAKTRKGRPSRNDTRSLTDLAWRHSSCQLQGNLVSFIYPGKALATISVRKHALTQAGRTDWPGGSRKCHVHTAFRTRGRVGDLHRYWREGTIQI